MAIRCHSKRPCRSCKCRRPCRSCLSRTCPIPLRGSLHDTARGEEIAGIADDDRSRSLGLPSSETSCSLPQNGVGALLTSMTCALGGHAHDILPEVETALMLTRRRWLPPPDRPSRRDPPPPPHTHTHPHPTTPTPTPTQLPLPNPFLISF